MKRVSAFLTLLIYGALLYPAITYAGTLTITENQGMSFGILSVPASGSQYMELSANNDSLTGTGTSIGGSSGRGIYLLKTTGTADSSFITIDISAGSTGSASLSLSHFAGNYDGGSITSFPAGSQPEPGLAGKLLYLGARATYDNLIGSGTTLTPSFDIMVIYE